MKKTIFFLLFGIILLAFPRESFAQAFSVSMQPQLQEIISKKDKIITLPYTVTNYGDPQVIILKVYKLGIKDQSGTYTLKELEENHPVTFEITDSTIQLNSPFLMKSKNTFSFTIAMKVPADAPEKDYYYAVVAESEAQKGFGNTSSVLVQGLVGSHILLTVSESGETEQKGSLVQFDILEKQIFTFNNKKFAIFDSSEHIALILSAANKGKNYTRASGSITLLPYFYNGKPKEEIQESFTMIPQFLLAGTQGTLKASENANQQHSLILPAPFMGIYRLSSVVSFGENAQVAFADVAFIVFPYKSMSVFILAFITIFLIGKFVHKKYQTRIK